MKNIETIFFGLAITAAIIVLPARCCGHDQIIHMAISESAAKSSSGLNAFLQQILGVSPDSFTETPTLSGSANYYYRSESPIEWVKSGSFYEDEDFRFTDHFYTLDVGKTPKAIYGLTDDSEFPLPAGIIDSFSWATNSNGKNPVTGELNTEKWRNARDYEYTALSGADNPTREDGLTHMLYALGHVLHLNQDLSQPDHVRNDEHYKKSHRWIENYGSAHYAQNLQWFDLPKNATLGWANWQALGFNKLRDFWDRDHYLGNASALNADYNGNDKLGLAEFSNGNFLGEDAIYGEYFSSANKAYRTYFPFPSRDSSTQYKASWQNPLAYIDGSFRKDGTPIKRVYLQKTGDGVKFGHHSLLNYLDTMAMTYYPTPSIALNRTIYTPTIDDDTVLQDYHSILLPKAVEYSTGILDYFFRSDVVAEPAWDSSTGKFDMLVVNFSGQTLSGGLFQLFYDDHTTGKRTPVSDADFSGYGGSLDDGHYFDVPFSPQTDATNYVLIYKGTIGVDASHNALDPVDDGIAIAASSFPAALITTGSPLPDGTINQAYSQQLAEIGLVAPIQWTFTSGSLPDGLQLGGDGSISGTPGNNTAGQYSFTVQASDAYQVVTSDFDLKIDPPCFTTDPKLPDAESGQQYSATITPPANCIVIQTGGTIPPGLNLDSFSGALSGTTTSAGDYSFTIGAFNGSSEQCHENFSLHVSGCFANNSTLPDAIQYNSYSVTFTPLSPPAQYSMTLSGNIPQGMTFGFDSGSQKWMLQGTPSIAGNYTFTVHLIDGSNHEMCAGQFTLNVLDCPDWNSAFVWGTPTENPLDPGATYTFTQASANWSASISTPAGGNDSRMFNAANFNWTGPACNDHYLMVDVTADNRVTATDTYLDCYLSFVFQNQTTYFGAYNVHNPPVGTTYYRIPLQGGTASNPETITAAWSVEVYNGSGTLSVTAKIVDQSQCPCCPQCAQ